MPKVIRSGVQPSRAPSRPHWPCRDARKPVITSSLTNSAPCAGAGLGEELVEARVGRDDAHVAGGRLGDQAGDPVAQLGEQRGHGVAVVVGQHPGERGGALGYAGSAGDRERGQSGAGRGQQRVDVPVVAAGELHDDVAAGEAPGQPDRRHRGLGTGGDEADLLDRRPPDDLLGELDLGLGRRAVRRAARDRVTDGGHHLGVGVAEQHRAPGADQVDVLLPVDVGQPGACGGPDEARGPADGVEGTDRRVHAAGRDRARAREERLGPVGSHRAIVSEGGNPVAIEALTSPRNVQAPAARLNR